MSKLSRVAATAQTLSVTAMEEASRWDHAKADIEHLLLALVLDSGTAGQVLRGLGLTIDDAREAVEAQHAAQLRGLGVETGAPERGSLEPRAGMEWGERALKIITHPTTALDVHVRDGESALRGGRAPARRKRSGFSGESSEILYELVGEPSGFIEEVLGRLGTTPGEVRAALVDACRVQLAERRDQRVPGELSARAEVFVAAPIERVWALLADPMRRAEWDAQLERVEVGDGPRDAPGEGTREPRPGDAFVGFMRTELPDGKPVKLRPEFIRRSIEVLEAEAPVRIAWLVDFPDAPRANPVRLTIELSPAAGGSQARVTWAWLRRRGGWRRVVGWVLRPLQRVVTWVQVSQVGAQLSRSFR